MESNLSRLEETFLKMKSNGFDTKKPLKWSFYFIDKVKAKLENVYLELKDYSYSVDEFRKTEDDYWQLKVSKTEVLIPDKLHRRNTAFNELADHYLIELYDGWDVEKPENLLE